MAAEVDQEAVDLAERAYLSMGDRHEAGFAAAILQEYEALARLVALARRGKKDAVYVTVAAMSEKAKTLLASQAVVSLLEHDFPAHMPVIDEEED